MSVEFTDRIRFNWGFHDAAHAFRMGWACPGHYWGFAMELGREIHEPADIMRVHTDKVYATGWLLGLSWAESGKDCTSSEPAWICHHELAA